MILYKDPVVVRKLDEAGGVFELEFAHVGSFEEFIEGSGNLDDE